MDPEQIEILFKSIDKSGDGTVSLRELDNMFSKFDMKVEMKDVRAVLKKHDKDGSKGISFNEFKSLITDVFKRDPTKVEAYNAFQVFDVDKDGKISVSELTKTCKNLNKKMSTKKINDMIKSMDLDGNGKISFDEFSKAYALGLDF